MHPSTGRPRGDARLGKVVASTNRWWTVRPDSAAAVLRRPTARDGAPQVSHAFVPMPTACPRKGSLDDLVFLPPVRTYNGELALVVGPDGRAALPIPRSASHALRNGGVLEFCSRGCNPRGTEVPLYHVRDNCTLTVADPMALVREVAIAALTGPAAAEAVLGRAAMADADMELIASWDAAIKRAGERAAAAKRGVFLGQRREASGAVSYAAAWATPRTRAALASQGFEIYLRILTE